VHELDNKCIKRITYIPDSVMHREPKARGCDYRGTLWAGGQGGLTKLRHEQEEAYWVEAAEGKSILVGRTAKCKDPEAGKRRPIRWLCLKRADIGSVVAGKKGDSKEVAGSFPFQLVLSRVRPFFFLLLFLLIFFNRIDFLEQFQVAET
jgi:hypothetical protein